MHKIDLIIYCFCIVIRILTSSLTTTSMDTTDTIDTNNNTYANIDPEIETRPITWEDILAKRDGAKFVFNRTPEVYSKYVLGIIRSRNTYNRYSDNIKINILKWKAVLRPEDLYGRIHAVQCENSLPIVLTPNAYPYNLTDDIQHYILWSVDPLSTERMNEEAQKRLALIPGIGTIKKFVAYVNLPTEQSIPDIWHCHVFFTCTCRPS